jgi:uncharacterized protein (DUF1330 family)
VDTNVRFYHVVLISVRDSDLFERYQTTVAPVALDYGGIERQLLPEQVYAEGVQRPDIVNVVYGRSPDFLRRLDADPRFQAVVSMRSDAIDMISITGDIGRGHSVPFRPDLIKIAYFDDGTAMDRMHTDPDPGHARIEGELYTAAVAESVWFVARARAIATHGSTATASAPS